MQVVGWYHSHPTFKPDPSVTDIMNQESYQRLMRDERDVASSGKVRVPTLVLTLVLVLVLFLLPFFSLCCDACMYLQVWEPFVGLIVSTYDTSLTTAQSEHMWFQVQPYT